MAVTTVRISAHITIANVFYLPGDLVTVSIGTARNLVGSGYAQYTESLPVSPPADPFPQYAMDDVVVLTVNGIGPDPTGNVDIEGGGIYAHVLVLSAGAAVPTGTPTGTVIVRRA